MTPMQNWMAGGIIRPCRFVKIQTDGVREVLEADANERVIGISQEGSRKAPGTAADDGYAAIDGDQVTVYSHDGQECNLMIGSGGITAGALIKSDADGQGVAAATTGTTAQNVGAIALESASAGEFCRVRIFLQYSIYPALA